jgi:tol-pal system protein YbgF
MKKYSVVLVVIISSFFVFQGCANLTVLRTQELRNVESQVDSLHMELTAMQKKLFEEQQSQSEVLRLIRADQQMRFNDLDRKFSAIEGNLSENYSRLSKIDEKTAAVNKRLDAKFAADSIAANSQAAEIEKYFQIAMSDFNAGRYDLSMDAFKDFSVKYADSPLAEEAQYWVGECLYAKKNYSDSERAYIEYVKKYPQGTKACVALYKLGLVYERLDKAKSKAMVWKKLIERCPDTQEAQVVKAQSGN